MARGQTAAVTAVSGGRQALLLLRPRGAEGSLSPAAAGSSRDRRPPLAPARRCLGDWQRPAAPPGPRAAVTAVNGRAGWWRRRVGGTGRENRRRCGERGENWQGEGGAEGSGGGMRGESGGGVTSPGPVTSAVTSPAPGSPVTWGDRDLQGVRCSPQPAWELSVGASITTGFPLPEGLNWLVFIDL